jgi:hypothetical protein
MQPKPYYRWYYRTVRRKANLSPGVALHRAAPTVSVGVGACSGVGGGVEVSTGMGVSVTLRVGIIVGVGLVEVRGVTVGGADRKVGDGNLVGVANGVRVMVGVAVGTGVPGVMVGVGVAVRDGVGVGVLVGGTRTLVAGCVVASPSSVIIAATVLNGVAVGRPRGIFCSGYRSHAESPTAMKTKKLMKRDR